MTQFNTGLGHQLHATERKYNTIASDLDDIMQELDRTDQSDAFIFNLLHEAQRIANERSSYEREVYDDND